MSGVEIAGLVLGAIPLVISAIEHYEDFLDPTKAFFLYRGELARAIRELGVQHASYELSIRILLEPVTSDQELSDMLENTKSSHWQDPEIDEALRSQLGKAYASYMRINKDIQAVVVMLAEKLNINGADRVTTEGLEAIISAYPPAKEQGSLSKFQLGERVQFTMNRRKIRKLLDGLKALIEDLDKLHAKADMLQPPQTKSTISFALPLKVIQRNAGRVYTALSQAWCTHHTSHSAGLLLEQRLATKSKRRTPGSQKKRDAAEAVDCKCFEISVLQAKSPDKWLDVEIRLVELPVSINAKMPKVQIVAPAPSLPTISTVASAEVDPTQLNVVRDLCSALQQCSHACVGFCLDDNDNLRGDYPVSHRKVSFLNSGISLKQMLQDGTRRFSRLETYTLAITLTSSLLQLCRTPWLFDSWNKANIVFLRAQQISGSVFDLRHPYLTREHTKSGASHARPGVQANKDCTMMLALGIMLLEVHHGQPIESLRRDEDLGPNSQPNELTDLSAARRWLQERQESGDVTFAFRSAISHCMKSFVDPVASLDNEDFAKTVEVQVLAPLQEEMDYIIHGPAL